MEAGESTRDDFLTAHSRLLERLRSIHSPHLERLPLLEAPSELNKLKEWIRSTSLSATVKKILQEGTRLRLTPLTVIVVPLRGVIQPFSVIPGAEPVVVIGSDPPRESLAVTIARAMARADYWIERYRALTWEPWQLVQHTPLRQWLEAERHGWLAAQTLNPELSLAQLFGLTQTAWQRLREQERRYRKELDLELEFPGPGTLFRWFPPDGWQGLPGRKAKPIPPRMGSYLAWRGIS